MRFLRERHSIPGWLVATGFALLVLALRSRSFFLSVENWDESLYLLMARSLLEGHPLYSEVWELKPPGLYLVFVLAQLLFGRTILAIRILGVLAVCSSCVLLFLLGRSLRDQQTGIVAGLLYAVFSLETGGLATNSEILFTPFVLLTFYLFFTNGADGLAEKPRWALALGLSAALALQIKPVVAFDFLALSVLILTSAWWGRKRVSGVRLLRLLLWLAAGPLTTIAIIVVYFLSYGHLADYLYANFTVNLRFASQNHLDLTKLAWMIRLRMREAFPLWLCFFLAPGFLFFFRPLDRDTRSNLASLLLWSTLALAGICSTGRLFPHYFLQILPPLCMLCALILLVTIESGAQTSPARTALILSLVLAGPFLRTIYRPLSDTVAFAYHRYVRGTEHWGDQVSVVAEYLRSRMGKNDYLYIADYQPILYYLVPAKAPTKYVFPTHLVREEWRRLLDVNLERELAAIFDKKPLYVVVTSEQRPTSFYGSLHQYLEQAYRLEQTIGDVELYRRLP